MSIMSGFRASDDGLMTGLRQQASARVPVSTENPNDPRLPTPVLADGRSAEYVDFQGRVKAFDYQTLPRYAMPVPKITGPVGTRGFTSQQDMDSVMQARAITDQRTGAPSLVDVVDSVFRGVNTGIAGSQLLLNAVFTPRGRARLAKVDGDPTDEITFGDLGQIYQAVWDSKITPGQAIAITYGDYMINALTLTGVQRQQQLDDYIEADTQSRMTDPTNTRKLGSWLTGLHSDFDVFNENQLDSAFNQGLGRWITGTSDAALMWFAGIDVLAAKGIALGYKTATSKVLRVGGARGAIDANAFEIEFLAGVAGTKVTPEYELIDSIYRMTPEQAAFHDIVLQSDNPALAAKIFGAKFETRQEALDAFLTAAGSVKHAQRLQQKRIDLYDELFMARTERDALRWNIERGANREALDDMGDSMFGLFGMDMTAENVKHLDDVANLAKEEFDRVRSFSDFTTGRFQDEVIVKPILGRYDRGVKGEAIRYDKRANSTSRRSAAGMETRAQRRLDKFTGSAYEHAYFNVFGRPVRFVTLRSGLDYLGRHRQTGVLNFQDHTEFLNEFKAALSTTPFLRKAAKAKAGDPRREIRRELPDGTVVVETVEAFRTRLLNEAIEAASYSPAQKAAWIEGFEQQMADALGQYLSHTYKNLDGGVTRSALIEAAKKYSTKRSIVRGHIQNHAWIADNGNELTVLDEVTLATQRNGYTLMDFRWLEKTFNLHMGSPLTKGAATGVRGFLTALDYVWRPLVLLRLGYTQRNLAEGYLRTLAGMGEVPTSGSMGTSSKNFFLNSGDRMAGGFNRMKNWRFKRRGIKKIRKQMDAMQSKQQQDLAAQATSRAEYEAAAKELKQLRKRMEAEAREELLTRTKRTMTAWETPVYSQIADDLTEAQLAMLDTADTLIYNAGDVNSLMARGLLAPDPETGVGVADAEALTRKALGEDAVDFADEYDSIYSFMTPRQQAAYDDLVATNWDEASGQWSSREAFDRGEEMVRSAYFRRINQLLKADFRIGRIGPSGEFKVLRSNQISLITLEDLTSGAIVAVPKGTKPQYAKADVYGGVLDIRTNVQTEVFNVARQVEQTKEVGANNLVFLNGDTRNLQVVASERLRSLFGDDFVDYVTTKTVAGDTFDGDVVISRTLGESMRIIDNAFAAIERDPSLLRAIALKRWVDNNADRLPEGFTEWALKKRLILPNEELARILRTTKRTQGKLMTAQQRRDDLLDYLNDPATWDELARDYGLPLHAGRELPDDVLADVLVNQRTIQYLHGPGLYSIVDAGPTSRGYFLAHVRGQSDTREGTPVVYALPDPRDYAWINLDEVALGDYNPISGVTEVSPVVQDMLQVLDQPRFASRGGMTLGAQLRFMIDNGDFDSMASNPTVGDIYYQIRALVNEGFVSPAPTPIEARVPKRFFDDHVMRLDEQDTTGIELVQEGKSTVVVRLNQEAYRNMISDARFYSDPLMRSELAAENRSVVDSAARAVKSLERFEDSFTVPHSPPEAVLYDVIEALRNAGYDGFTHFSGMEGKSVYGWWAKDIPMIRVDEVSDAGLDLLAAEARIGTLKARLDDLALEEGAARTMMDMGPESLTTASRVSGMDYVPNAKLEQLLVQYARDKGYGKVLLDDPSTVEGYRALFVPDMMATNEGYLDSLIPGQVAAAGRGKSQVMDVAPGAVNRQALEEFDPDLAKVILRGGALSNTNKAKLVMFMESGGYTHILLPAGKGNPPVLTSASELLSTSKSGLAYARLALKDEVDELRALKMSKSEDYAQITARMENAKARLARLSADIGNRRETIRDLAGTLDRVRTKRDPRRVVTDERVNITGSGGRAQLETGAPFDPNEALSGQYMSMSSSGSFHDLLLVGYMQNRYAQYERSFNYTKYDPGQENYWLALANLANENIRQEPILRRLAALPRVRLDDEAAVAAQNERILDDLMKDDAFRSGAQTGLYPMGTSDRAVRRADPYVGRHQSDETDLIGFDFEELPDDLVARINEYREKLYSWIPDEEVMRAVGEGPVTADFLASRMAWRTDLTSIMEKDLVPIGNLYRRFINRGMNALGTVPEDRLLRHPFYQKRWMEEMQRQVDAYEVEGIESFTQAQIDAMRRRAHDFALKTTRSTLYTVTRLSTPAAALGLLIPFFPAWENALRFWTKALVSRPENAMRYIQAWNAPNAMGMVVDQDGNPIEAKRGIFGLPEALFAPGGAQIQFFLPEGLTEKIPKKPDFLPSFVPWLSIGTKGEVRIAKGALNVALQGDYPWLTNFGPIVTAPLSYIAAQKPDITQAVLDFKPGGAPIGEAIAKQFIPFGRPTAEKDIWGVLSENFTPATVSRMITYARGMTDPQFVGTVEEIRRDMMVDWERRGRPEGEEPSMEEAVARAREFFALRAVTNFTAFAAPSFQSKYQGEIEEWRRIETKHRQIVESYEKFGLPLPEDTPVGYQAALREFLDLHGKSFFYLTQSSSGRSGIGASVPEYKIIDKHGALASKLAGDGEDDWVAMITSPYADKFSYAVYANQMNRAFDNSTTLMRGGNPDDVIEKSRVALGWILYRDGMNELDAMLEEAGFTSYEQSGAESYKDMKSLLIADIASQYPEWDTQRLKFDRGEWKVMLRNVEMILDDKSFMKDHGEEPLWVDVREWYDARQELGQLLLDRKREGGSSNITASSNEDLLMMWETMIAEKKRANIKFAEFHNRFLDYDTLLPGDPTDIVLESEIIPQGAPSQPFQLVLPGGN